MKKTFCILSLFALVLGTLGGCVVEDDVADDDPDTTVVNPPAPSDDTDVTVTPPSGGSVDIDR